MASLRPELGAHSERTERDGQGVLGLVGELRVLGSRPPTLLVMLRIPGTAVFPWVAHGFS